MERASSKCSDMDTGSDFTSITGEELLVDVSTAGGSAVVEDKVFVAVGRELKASKSTLVWALQNAGTKKVVIIHVHQPAQTISILGGKFPISQLGEQEVKAHLEMERRKVSKIMEEYCRMCSKAGVEIEKEYIEMTSIERGIVELINKFRIGLLIMGAAADNKFSRKMIEPKSKKAVYVRQHAPPSCHIWFACKGRLIYTREATMSSSRAEESVIEQNPVRVDSNGTGVSRASSPSPCNSSAFSTPWSRSIAGESSFDEFDQSSTMSLRLSFGLSPRSEAAGNSPFSSIRTRDRDPGLPLLALPSNIDDLHGPSVSNLTASSMNDHLYEHLEQAMAEAETSKRQAFEESTRRCKAEKDTVDAMRKVRLAENLYFDEVRRRKEVEEELAKSKNEFKEMKYERDKIIEKLRAVLDQKAVLENRLERSDAVLKETEEKVVSVLELLKIYNKE
ncbi:hypothetical protein V2J09_004475 [Rumex salicifolius]